MSRPDLFGRTLVKLFAITLFLGWTAVAQSADLSVHIKDAPADGVLVFQVYDSANAFGDFRDPVKEMRSERRADGTYLINDVPAGDVALLVYVDENDNGVIDKNFIGIPKEPLGLSNNYRPKGPPAFSRAAFPIAENESAIVEIQLYKVLGERGRLGVGAGVIGRGSPYVGSDTTVLQPIPAITYNGERLQWLGPNVRYGIAGAGWWRLAASASYRVGVYEESDSAALAGLGDRDSTLMAGLGLRFEVPGGLNLSLSYEHDVLDNIGGGSATARLSKGFQTGWFRFAPQLQVNWLSAELTNYDFGVPPESATVTRPEYNTGSSVSYELGFGSFIELTEDWRIVLNVSAEFLPSEIVNSPIVADDHVIKGFAAIIYVF
jgi:outer membrane protein